MRTVTLGPTGTYSHRAAGAVADDDDEIEFRESVREIVAAVADGEAPRGVVPIENSIEGSVTETLDALAEFDVAVVREIITPIRHALLAQSESFDTVASHPQALAQCREYLAETYPDAALEAVASTAAGVDLAREDASVAGIGHPDNATGNLVVVAEDIQDRRSNATRFFVLAPPDERTEAGAKTSLIVSPGANYPGLLLELLTPFAERDLDFTRVESRPTGERLGDYLFHFDVAGGLFEERTREAVAEVEAIAADGWVRRLGSYDVEHVV